LETFSRTTQKRLKEHKADMSKQQKSDCYADRLHILPLGDLRTHDRSPNCWCEPSIEEEGKLIIHNSADGREFFE
jgi:hypothetical protein